MLDERNSTPQGVPPSAQSGVLDAHGVLLSGARSPFVSAGPPHAADLPKDQAATPIWAAEAHPALMDFADRKCRECPAWVGIAVQDRVGAIVGANERAAELLGLPWDQLVGRSSMDPRWSVVGEDGRPIVGPQHPAMIALATGEAVRGAFMGVLLPPGSSGRAGEGGIRWISVDVLPIRNQLDDADEPGEDGELVGVVALFTEAREPARVQRASDALLTVYRQLAEQTSDVAWQASVDGVIDWVSPDIQEVLGWLPDEFIGRPFREVIHRDDFPTLERAQDELAQGRRARIDVRILAKSGHYRWTAVTARPVTNADGERIGSVGGWHDIDEHVRARHDLAKSEERYRLLASNVSDVVLQLNSGGRVVWASPSLETVLGWRPAEWTGTMLIDWIYPGDHAAYQRDRLSVDSGERLQVRGRVRASSGRYHWVSVNVAPYSDADGRPTGQILSFRLADDDVAREEELERLARLDALTGLLNRESARTHMESLSLDRREHGDRLAVLFCDVDEFKAINDEYGHAAGDAVLRAIAGRITEVIRGDDLAARVGGDEYLVVLHGQQDIHGAAGVAEKIRRAGSEPVWLGDIKITPTMSIGVALAEPGEDVETLIGRADSAMYLAKRAGRDQVVTITGDTP